MKWGWIVQMAWRDSRKNRSKLILFISAIVLGIAALVAIGAFGENLQYEINRQAATLIGADLEISTRKPLVDKEKHFIDSLKDLSVDMAHERQFASMVQFVKNRKSRLVQVRALEGKYPFYGALETTPKNAVSQLNGHQAVLVEKTLLLQYDAQVGDSVQLGTKRFYIAGALESSPGKTAVSGIVAPTVFMPLPLLRGTGLTQKGSRINDHYYFMLKPGIAADKLVAKLDSRLEELDLRASTITSTKEDTGRAFTDLNDFLSLVGFVALLLGSLGVASAVHIYIKEKLMSVAILRCLGASNRQIFLIFLIQVVGLGLIAGLLGAMLGTFIQQLIPVVLKDFLPIEVGSRVSWKAIVTGTFTGVAMAVLFALLPLLSTRHVSALNTLRIQEEQRKGALYDPLHIVVIGFILLFIVGFAKTQLHDWNRTLSFCVGTLLAFGILYAIAWLGMFVLKRNVPASWPYVWRQGLANLYRPNNQTLLLVVTIGLATAFMASLFFIQHILLNRIEGSASKQQPNMVLFDIQRQQQIAVEQLTRSLKLPIIQKVPVVTMQLTRIKGYTAEAIRKDSSLNIPLRGFGGEIRATYRDSLMETEKITKGKWIGRSEAGDTAYISLDQRYARRIGVDIGDELVFNVQGVPIPTKVGSFRSVDWNRMQTNFRVVFPKGIIDDAPQFFVIMTRTPDEQVAARFQRLIVGRFPNVSIIDLKLILAVLDDLLGKISFVIQFIGAFSIATGVVVLIASVLLSKYQRVKENVLLRTVGASRRQLFSITGCEYFLLGAMASLIGLLLALIACFLLASFVFEATFVPPFGFAVLLIVLVTALTILIGLFNSLSTINRSPLMVLRKQA